MSFCTLSSLEQTTCISNCSLVLNTSLWQLGTSLLKYGEIILFAISFCIISSSSFTCLGHVQLREWLLTHRINLSFLIQIAGTVKAKWKFSIHLHKGSFKNYVDKIRWVGGQIMPILVHVQCKKCPRGGRQVVKKGQNYVQVVIE